MIINALSSASPKHVISILATVHRLPGFVCRLSNLLRIDAQLFAAAGAKRIHHQQYQIAVWNFLHAKWPLNTKNICKVVNNSSFRRVNNTIGKPMKSNIICFNVNHCKTLQVNQILVSRYLNLYYIISQWMYCTHLICSYIYSYIV